jgi:predicted LPLAT superfamily acyltransferase
VLGRRPTALDLLRHLYTFSATIVDRVYFLLGRFNEFDVRTFGTEPLREALARGGCVLMGSHLGSFEALRACGRNEGRYEIVMLMDEVNARRIGEVLAALNPQAARGVINVGDAASILKAKERLDAGALVGVLGDRLRPGDRPLACEFLGAPAWLPNRPLALASVLKAPVFLGFGLYRGGNRYDVHFEQLSGPLDYPRRERAQMLGAIARQYAARLEHYARLAPYNWFNFYDFWERPPTRK